MFVKDWLSVISVKYWQLVVAVSPYTLVLYSKPAGSSWKSKVKTLDSGPIIGN